jgi:hypothetical protein
MLDRNRHPSTRLAIWIASLVACLSLQACGGGGGDDTATTQPPAPDDELRFDTPGTTFDSALWA